MSSVQANISWNKKSRRTWTLRPPWRRTLLKQGPWNSMVSCKSSFDRVSRDATANLPGGIWKACGGTKKTRGINKFQLPPADYLEYFHLDQLCLQNQEYWPCYYQYCTLDHFYSFVCYLFTCQKRKSHRVSCHYCDFLNF